MTEQNQNGCAEPIGQALRRHGVPDQLVADIERDYRDLYRLMQREQPRTITLAYTPRAADDDERAGDDDFDAGGHWTIYEQGNASPPLEQQEALALIAAMLLGAKHPPLRSLFGTWRATARANRRVREAREERDRIDGERMDLAHALGAARDRLHSLPWELAHVLCAELRRGSPLPAKPEDIREVFALPLLELAHRMGLTPAREPTVAAESEAPAPETYRGAALIIPASTTIGQLAKAEADVVELPVRLDDKTCAVLEDVAKDAGVTRDQAASVVAGVALRRALPLESVEEATREADRAMTFYAPPASFSAPFGIKAESMTVEFHVGGLGRFTMTGVPVHPRSLEPLKIKTTLHPAPEAVHETFAIEVAAQVDTAREGAASIVEAMAAEAEREEALQEDADAAELQRAIDAELEDLADMLDAAGRARSVHELREWPDDWRIDAQNWALAMRAWMESSAGNEEPAAPWFLTGEPEPLESIEARAGEERAGFGLEPIGDVPAPTDVAAPPSSVMSQVVAAVGEHSFGAVPRDAVSGAPGELRD